MHCLCNELYKVHKLYNVCMQHRKDKVIASVPTNSLCLAQLKGHHLDSFVWENYKGGGGGGG